MRFVLPVVIFSTLASMQAYAGYAVNTNIIRDKGRLSISAGHAAVKSPNESLYLASELVNGSTSYKIGRLGFGGQFTYEYIIDNNWFLGPEIGVHDNGYSEYKIDSATFNDTIHVRSQDIDLLARLSYHSDGGFNMFARGGMAYVMQDVDTVPAYGSTVSSNKTHIKRYAPEVGFGIGYDFENDMGISVDYRHIVGESVNNFRTNTERKKTLYSVDAVMFTIGYRFDI